MNEISTIQQAIERFLGVMGRARSKNTFETYGFALKAFTALLADRNIDPQNTPVAELPDAAIGWFAESLNLFAPATEQLYLQATIGFYEFLAAESLAAPNLPHLRLLMKQRSRRTGKRLPQFPREEIEKIIEAALAAPLPHPTEAAHPENLRILRDRAFLVTLADTGLRVHEACGLRRGDMDWNEGRAIIIGKGDKEAVIRFSRRSMQALKEYLTARGGLDGASGRPLGSLALFARHDKGAGKKIRPVTTATGRNVVEDWAQRTLGDESKGKITPHSFRHYFVTTVLRGSGNLKLAQELARHSNIAVTQRYAHISDDELDKGYHTIFEKEEKED